MFLESKNSMSAMGWVNPDFLLYNLLSFSSCVGFNPVLIIAGCASGTVMLSTMTTRQGGECTPLEGVKTPRFLAKGIASWHRAPRRFD